MYLFFLIFFLHLFILSHWCDFSKSKHGPGSHNNIDPEWKRLKRDIWELCLGMFTTVAQVRIPAWRGEVDLFAFPLVCSYSGFLLQSKGIRSRFISAVVVVCLCQSCDELVTGPDSFPFTSYVLFRLKWSCTCDHMMLCHLAECDGIQWI